ncbi:MULTISPECIES: thiol-disulfide oxidoreductase DCC family protein [unclassified Rhodococcus (in: high G+C Gram-positive bacteria)]|uniref:thiol-disulfide oxidoreductase DCC family protein n=1 Tax=unclassified Rhodococcus (in: high G+C Gram-positive bacteria) TaxID=192944 RepID=UPI0012F6B198|nr:DUF393 domain-containing protein [Rhodococcus sp. DK17]
MGTLIFDADCGFCTRSASWLQRSEAFDLQAGQFVDDLAVLGLNEVMVSEAAHWCENGFLVASGSDAIGHALIARGGPCKVLGHFTLFPAVRPLAAAVYKVIAKNRHKMPGGTTACRIPQ